MNQGIYADHTHICCQVITMYHSHTGKLQMLQVIGQGTYGTVYKAVWRGTMVAVKVIPGSFGVIQREIEAIRYDV